MPRQQSCAPSLLLLLGCLLLLSNERTGAAQASEVGPPPAAPAAVDLLASDGEPDGLKVGPAELDAELAASRSIAEVFAKKAADSLARRSEDERTASVFEATASTLRQNATLLSRQAANRTEAAASSAAEASVRKVQGKVAKLEQQAREAAGRAEESRSAAGQAMRQALSAQAEMTRNLHGQQQDEVDVSKEAAKTGAIPASSVVQLSDSLADAPGAPAVAAATPATPPRQKVLNLQRNTPATASWLQPRPPLGGQKVRLGL